jgi:cell division protease FtsH
VEALRDALLERHELIGTDITDVLEAARAAGPAHDRVPALVPDGAPPCRSSSTAPTRRSPASRAPRTASLAG